MGFQGKNSFGKLSALSKDLARGKQVIAGLNIDSFELTQVYGHLQPVIFDN